METQTRNRDLDTSERSFIAHQELTETPAPNSPIPRALLNRAQHDTEALKEAGIHALAKAVSRELLADPKLQRRFQQLVAQHLQERIESGQPLPEVKLKGERQLSREEPPSARDQEFTR